MRTIVVLAALLSTGAFAGDDAPFTEAEIRAILAHGPWPTPITHRPEQPRLGQARRAGARRAPVLRHPPVGGRPVLLRHLPRARAQLDRQPHARRGAAEVDRNTPTLMNARLGRWFGWDGAADSLWSQSIRPILDRRELGASPRHVAELMRKDEELACRYRRAFGAAPSPTDDEEVLGGRRQDPRRVPGDLRDARRRPSTASATRSRRGERVKAVALLRGRAARRCASSSARAIAAPATAGRTSAAASSATTASPPRTPRSRAGRGAEAGAREPLQPPGRYNDDPKRAVRTQHAGEEGFKVPTLRHLMLTAPYGHHGEVATLADVVRHYSERGSAEREAAEAHGRGADRSGGVPGVHQHPEQSLASRGPCAL